VHLSVSVHTVANSIKKHTHTHGMLRPWIQVQIILGTARMRLDFPMHSLRISFVDVRRGEFSSPKGVINRNILLLQKQP
jgi:hypothetical protein